MHASRGLWWMLGGGLWLLACNGTVNSPDGSGGATPGSINGTAGEASGTISFGGAAGTGVGGASGCPGCPTAEGIQLCCADYCGYLNTESQECVSSIASSRPRPVVTGQGELCAVKPLCESSTGCPAELPAEGSACTEDRRCNYCAAPALPRLMRCLASAWVTIGPNPPCGYYVEPQ